MGMPDMGM